MKQAQKSAEHWQAELNGREKDLQSLIALNEQKRQKVKKLTHLQKERNNQLNNQWAVQREVTSQFLNFSQMSTKMQNDVCNQVSEFRMLHNDTQSLKKELSSLRKQTKLENAEIEAADQKMIKLGEEYTNLLKETLELQKVKKEYTEKMQQLKREQLREQASYEECLHAHRRATELLQK